MSSLVRLFCLTRRFGNGFHGSIDVRRSISTRSVSRFGTFSVFGLKNERQKHNYDFTRIVVLREKNKKMSDCCCVSRPRRSTRRQTVNRYDNEKYATDVRYKFFVELTRCMIFGHLHFTYNSYVYRLASAVRNKTRARKMST